MNSCCERASVRAYGEAAPRILASSAGTERNVHADDKADMDGNLWRPMEQGLRITSVRGECVFAKTAAAS